MRHPVYKKSTLFFDYKDCGYTCNPHKFEIPALQFPRKVPVNHCKHLQCIHYLPQTEAPLTTPMACTLKLIGVVAAAPSNPHILPTVYCPANVVQVSLTPIIQIDHKSVTLYTDRNILVNFLEVVIHLAFC